MKTSLTYLPPTAFPARSAGAACLKQAVATVHHGGSQGAAAAGGKPMAGTLCGVPQRSMNPTQNCKLRNENWICQSLEGLHLGWGYRLHACQPTSKQGFKRPSS